MRSFARPFLAVIGAWRLQSGSIGPRRFNLPIVLGSIDLTSETARITHIDCETGQQWTPPPARRTA